jgi:hypothetical protein
LSRRDFLASLALAADVGFFGHNDTAKQASLPSRRGCSGQETTPSFNRRRYAAQRDAGSPLLETATTSASANALDGQRPDLIYAPKSGDCLEFLLHLPRGIEDKSAKLQPAAQN